MKKLTLIVMITLLGCNGSSISNSPNTGGATSATSGGATGTPNGGTTGSTNGGTTGNSSGGAAGSSSGGMTGNASGATTGTATGGSTGTVTGGATSSGGTTGTATGGSTGTDTGGSSSGTGGAGATGGSNGTGGAGTPDAGVKNDANSVDTRRVDSGGTGGAQGTGGTQGTGGAQGTGGSSCVPAANPGSSGMNPGRACLSCHASGQSPKITAGGTIYSSSSGGTAVSGATVTIVDSTGKTVTVVTGTSGNFYTTTAITFPATVQVSKCPNTATMPTSASSGDCNSCHGSSSAVIHLP